VIRFSAALVAVAIGVLIGGIATSKLVLVYIAIAVSAVALVALAIGVMLKREELFGEGQGLVPAQAGAVPVMPARAGESHDQRPNGLVPPPPVQGAAVGPGAAFAERTPVASVPPGMPWAAPAAPDAWPAPAAPTAAVPAMWQAPPVPAGATASGWGAPAVSEPATAVEPVAQGSATTMHQAWDTQAPSVFAARSADAPPASPGVGTPDWFNPADRPGSAGTAAPGSADGWSWPSIADKEEQAEATAPAADAADDDWPTRYSWLDEEPEESGAGGDKPSDNAPVIASEPAALTGDATVAADVVVPEDAESGETAEADVAAPPTLRLVVPEPDPVAESVGTVETAAAATAAETLESAEDAATAELSSEREQEPEHGADSSAAEPAESTPGTGLVTVIRGVPRFHQEDCVLIRFMPEGDTQKLPVAEAREAGCTPCAACQPEG